MFTDTIAAISTPLGEGGIAIIRVSGEDAVTEVERIFRSKTKLSEAASHTIQYGYIVDLDTQERVEEVLVSLMRGPRSYTTEDVVEINTHGGVVSIRRVMELLLKQRIRVAEPGEFTKRAFLNGRIDLSQAEAVMDLIRSKSDRAFDVAMKQAQGQLSTRIKALRHTLVETLAHIEVNIDYPEHDVEELTSAYIQNQCGSVITAVDRLLKTASEGKILREGIVTAIIGRPNVGKSSLLNALAQDNKAIVTDIPGTTRDVIEEMITINGIPLRLLDTAGMRETSDVVERIGVERSRSALQEADLILYVLNNNEPLHDDERELLREVMGRQVIVIVNKMDLPNQLDITELESINKGIHIVKMSAMLQEGIDALEKAISDMFFTGKIESQDATYVSNVRHIGLLHQAKKSLTDAVDAAKAGIPIDMIQIDVRTAWEQLGEIIGDAVGESLIDQIFSQFCLGK
ncbi:tRNA uridine-5-carboxymethylaminomethyl(34) synthesis GTPase MnmE [Paenibacillus marinisediminis]